MKTAIEAYVSIFIVFICAILCVCLISANLSAAGARDAYTTYTLQLQDSNYANSVIAACTADAESRGYTIIVNVYDLGNGQRSGSVELQYDYSIPVLGYTTERYIRGYSS